MLTSIQENEWLVKTSLYVSTRTFLLESNLKKKQRSVSVLIRQKVSVIRQKPIGTDFKTLFKMQMKRWSKKFFLDKQFPSKFFSCILNKQNWEFWWKNWLCSRIFLHLHRNFLNFFFGILLSFAFNFSLSAKNLRSSGKKIRQVSQNCVLRVQRNFLREGQFS